MKILIVGYGKMGRLIDELASAQGHTVVGRVDEGRDEWAPADAAIDF
jgi:4-hydroxy-tetrahydrodipicolinate reductase